MQTTFDATVDFEDVTSLQDAIANALKAAGVTTPVLCAAVVPADGDAVGYLYIGEDVEMPELGADDWYVFGFNAAELAAQLSACV